MKFELEAMLKQPVTGTTYTGSYITSDPRMLEMLRRGNTFDRKRDPLEEAGVVEDTPSKKRRKQK